MTTEEAKQWSERLSAIGRKKNATQDQIDANQETMRKRRVLEKVKADEARAERKAARLAKKALK